MATTLLVSFPSLTKAPLSFFSFSFVSKGSTDDSRQPSFSCTSMMGRAIFTRPLSSLAQVIDVIMPAKTTLQWGHTWRVAPYMSAWPKELCSTCQNCSDLNLMLGMSIKLDLEMGNKPNYWFWMIDDGWFKKVLKKVLKKLKSLKKVLKKVNLLKKVLKKWSHSKKYSKK